MSPSSPSSLDPSAPAGREFRINPNPAPAMGKSLSMQQDPPRSGGNSLDVAPASIVSDYVRNMGGHTVITKVLICNNGIAAVKEIRSIRKWAYETFGSERAIEFTVMATPEDLKVNADYIRMADQYVEVPGGTNNNNYANVDLIVDIAERAGVHAVWAGWGHASENPRLPESLAASAQKIVFIGPPGSAMRSLGDKISSTIVAQSAKVPCMPWSGTGVEDTVMSDKGFLTVADDVYQKACIHSAEEGLERAQAIGFPVMVKASEGGGGKGIRKVDSPDAFRQAYNAVLGEVPGSPVFVMKLAGSARHLEVQLLADQYGNAISIFGRDCSVQRRHQKIIEEAPVTIAKEETFEKMEKAAVRLAKLVGYVSAGTVEYLYSAQEDKFYFLELNPRLQVEHPTTEMVSGVNIPAAQLQVAMGVPLHRIRDIRVLYGMDPRGTEPIDFDFVDAKSALTQRKPQPKGHVVAVRITAENPDAGFKPSSGNLQELNFRSSTNVWGYFSVGTAGGLHEFADSQFGHLFAYGADRSESRKNMVIALKELSIRGDFRTTVEYLIKLLETEAFEKNTITTGWLDTLISERLTAERPDPTLAVVCGGVTKAFMLASTCADEYKRVLEKGQVPARDTLKTVFQIDFIYENTRYAFTATRSSPTGWTLYLNGGRTQVSARPLADGGLLVGLNGKSHTVYWREEVGATRLMVDQKTCLIEQENDPTQVRSPSPGKLVRYLVESGDHVKAGQAIAEIEVMKMYLPLVAAEDGIAQFVKQPGSALEPGDIIGILSLDDPSRVQHAKAFEGQLPPLGLPNIVGAKPHQRFKHLLETLNNILDGYDNQSTMQSSIRELFEVLRNPELPYGEAAQVLSSLSGRMPSKLEETIRTTLDQAHHRHAEFPSSRLRRAIDSYANENVRPVDRPALTATLAPLSKVIEDYRSGLKVHEWITLAGLLERYYETEKIFSGQQEDVVLVLRDEHKSDLDKVVSLVLSHSKTLTKNGLIIAILNAVKEGGHLFTVDEAFSTALDNLANLDGRSTAPVALKAREVVILSQLPSLEERSVQMEQILKGSVTESFYGSSGEGFRLPVGDVLRELSDSRFSVFDVLPIFFDYDSPDAPSRLKTFVSLAAFEVYIRRAYKAYSLSGIDYHGENEDEPLALAWRFNLSKATDIKKFPTVANEISAEARSKGSVSDLKALPGSSGAGLERLGVMTSCNGLDELPQTISEALALFPRGTAGEDRHNVLNVAIRLFEDQDSVSDTQAQMEFVEAAAQFSKQFEGRGIRRVTFLICRRGDYPGFVTVRPDESDGGRWTEDKAIHNIEPALAYQLELSRLSNFDISPLPIDNRQIHIYHATGKANTSDSRFFVRALVRPGRIRGNVSMADYLISESDRLVNDILNALEVVAAQPEYRTADCNNIFLNFVYNLPVTLEAVQAALAGFIDRHGRRLWRLRVTSAEIRVVLEGPNGGITPMRAVIENVSGFVVKYEVYTEVMTDRGTAILKSVAPGPQGSLHLQPVDVPYPTKEWLQPKRYKAHIVGTTYCYDFPDLFRQAIRSIWSEAAKYVSGLKAPADPLHTKELVLDEDNVLQEVDRAPGSNTCGMVGWIFTMLTPEFPKGRRVVVVANDITYKIGSFGPLEDEYFFKVTELARSLGIPRIYLSANSGARIGLAEEVLGLFSAAWNDAGAPEKGFKYLYLTPDSYEKLQEKGSGSVITTEVEEAGERRYKVTDIIGLEDGLGVECLKGSGLIAGETSRAYDDIFTITLVTARSVGIGAYLVRLGQRTVQVEGQPIILTGAPALNKLLGREVYTSNLQLGGTQIMYKNGVSHLTAQNDLQGARQIVKWLSYVPARKNSPIPIAPSVDHWDREIGYVPTKSPYDPRWFIEGKQEESGEFLGGFFDKGSFQETLSGWATSVVVGRARLGGIPMGVIAVETRTLERVIPADPANPNSQEQKINEAGQVWYPNSAYKTAQAIFDFNREQLPLMIFSNWRGFSGGQQDMFDEILKQGSKIVDGLADYKQPVFVYIPPYGELRGGAFVVVHPDVSNNGLMEMYADEESRAGVLEPEGIVEVKYRAEKQRQTMARLDDTYKALLEASKDTSKSTEEQAKAKQALSEREEVLRPVYQSIAIHYSDLHDRAGRMVAKDVVRQALSWPQARRFFYWRLRRRLNEEYTLQKILGASPNLGRKEGLAVLNSLLDQSIDMADDMSVAKYIEQHHDVVSAGVEELRKQHVVRNVLNLLDTNRDAVLEALNQNGLTLASLQ